MTTRWRRARAFGTAFLLTLCGILLAVGLLLADVNSRRVTLGESAPPYAAAGGEWVRSALQEGELSSFFPAHFQVLGWLWEGEQWLVEQLINQ